jgi:hypothetical protein
MSSRKPPLPECREWNLVDRRRHAASLHEVPLER